MTRRITAAILLIFSMLYSTYAIADQITFSGMRTYGEGQYKVGKDFIAGEYVLICTSNYQGYFAISSDANGKNIIANDNFAVNSIITVFDGEYLKLTRCIAIEADDFYKKYSIKTENDGTMLKVGYDIMPGEYKVIAKSDVSGYYCIYNDSRHTKIVDNDVFKNSAWVTVRYGQYLVLSRCHIVN